MQIDASALVAKLTDKTVTWSTSNPEIAIVSQAGLVTGIKAGSCIVTATSNADPSKSASCAVTVVNNANIEDTDYEGLIINQVYGGGDRIDNDCPVSHSFVELYNTSNKTLDMSKVMLHYAPSGSDWNHTLLSGVLPPKCSYLIRGGNHTEPDKSRPNLSLYDYEDANGNVVKNYDFQWGVRFNNKGGKYCIAIRPEGDPIKHKNPYENGSYGYIDMLGVASTDEGDTVSGYEGDFLSGKRSGQSRFKGIRRIAFIDTDHNGQDFEPVDYRYFYESYNKQPRSLRYGPWDVAHVLPEPTEFQATFDGSKSNMINTTVIGDASTSRLVSWTTGAGYTNSYIEFVEVIDLGRQQAGIPQVIPSLQIPITSDEGSSILHYVNLTDLKPATRYEYRVSVGSYTSNFHRFRTAESGATINEPFTFLQITDTQCDTAVQYLAVKELLKEFETTLRSEGRMSYNSNYELVRTLPNDYDFLVHTGDIVNMRPDGNGDLFVQALEQNWRDYMMSVSGHIKERPMFTVFGNNDANTDGSMTNYNNHFGMIAKEGNYTFTYQNTHFTVMNAEKFTSATTAWFESVVASSEYQSATWHIVLTHRTRYMDELDNSSTMLAMTTAIESATPKVDLVLQGHKHAHMVTRPMKGGYQVSDELGTRYIMCNPSGMMQLTGKTKPSYAESFMEPALPTLNRFRIEGDRITMTTHALGTMGLLSEIDNFVFAKPGVIIPVEEIKLNQASIKGLAGSATGYLTSTVVPRTASDATVTYTSSNTSVVTVDANTGAYAIVGVGAATITATSSSTNGQPVVTAACAIEGFQVQAVAAETTKVGAENEGDLIILQAYGAHTLSPNSTAGTHSFIELYNNSKTNAYDLSGVSIWVTPRDGVGVEAGKGWYRYPLKGVILPRHSFTIRGIQYSNTTNKTTMFAVPSDLEYADPTEGLTMNKGMKVYLRAGNDLMDTTIVNPFNIHNAPMADASVPRDASFVNTWVKEEGYIDFIGVGGNDDTEKSLCNGYEDAMQRGLYGTGLTGNSKQRSLRRVAISDGAGGMMWKDTDVNVADFEVVNYAIELDGDVISEPNQWATNEYKRPRSLAYGAWEPGESEHNSN